MDLFTARYANTAGIVASGAVPVRTSIGGPRFRTGYTYAAMIELAPDREWLNLAQGPYEARYLDRLNALGVERIRAEFDRLDRGKGLALLCFENLNDPSAWCHRRMFAAWWEEQTGQPVPELPDSGRSRPRRQEPSLFGGFNVDLVSKSIHAKATRLLKEGKVRRSPGGWQVQGDTGSYFVAAEGDALIPGSCSCPSSMVCSHMVAAYMLNPTA